MRDRAKTSLGKLLELPAAERKIGPFLLVRQLGKGGFAPVWLAREVYGQTDLRAAAVKLFGLDAAAGDDAALHRDRILHEARSLCQVEHPNVVRFYSLIVDDERGVVGLAMEHVAGRTVAEELEDGALPIRRALDVTISVASALAAVHRAGLVHRDVKPANVVASGGLYKLIDFGIAAADAPEAHRPRAERVVLDDLPLDVASTKVSELAAVGSSASGDFSASGTIGYMDPVTVASGAPANASSDLYGLGATAFECLTGKLPAVAAAGGRGVSGEVLDGRIAPPGVAELVPGLPPGLAEVVDALLQPERNRRPGSAEAVLQKLERARSALAGRTREPLPESVGPFRGLGRFEFEDRDVYFGRTVEIASALELLRSRGLVALLGASGSGKSSLARAGVLPAVADGALGPAPSEWIRAVVTPGADPRAAIAAAIEPLVPSAAERSPEAVVALLAGAASAGRGVILLVDQLEELVTRAEGASRAWTARLLALIGREPVPGVRALVAARRDLLDPLLALPDLGPELVRGSLLVSPLSDASWGEVLDQALDTYGYRFEDEALRGELLAELEGTASAMPLVQFALTQLWEQRDVARKRVTRDGLRAIGGVAGALERHAEATLATVRAADANANDVARWLLLALTTPQGARATVSAQALAAQGEKVAMDPAERRASTGRILRALEEARLVVREGAGLTLAHEALLTQWARLRSWVAEAREDRLFAAEIERDAERWDAEVDETLLWKKRRLLAAEDFLRRGAAHLSERAEQFIDASRRADRRVKRIVAAALAVAAVASVGLGIAGGGALERRNRMFTAVAGAAVLERDVRAANEELRTIDDTLTDLVARLDKRDFPDAATAAASVSIVHFDVDRLATNGTASLSPRLVRALLDYARGVDALNATWRSLLRLLPHARAAMLAAWEREAHPRVDHSLVLVPHKVGYVIGEVWTNHQQWKVDDPWPMTYYVTPPIDSVIDPNASARAGREAERWVGKAVTFEDLQSRAPGGVIAIPLVPSPRPTSIAGTNDDAIFKLRWAVRDVRDLVRGNKDDPSNEVIGLRKQGEDLVQDLYRVAAAR